ncbi:MAG: long-chain fatty acid--CoA ligase [Bacillota bacterium]
MEQIKEQIWTINYEEGVKRSLQYPEVNVFHLLERTVRRYPRRVATYFGGSTMSYSELYAHVNKFAAALAGLGVKKGDRVGVFLPNSPQAVISYYALMRLGVIAVMINPVNVERELRFLIRDAGIKDLIVLDTLYRRVMNIRDKVELENLIVTDNHDYLSFPHNILYLIKQYSKGRAPDIPKRKGIYSFTKLIRNAPDKPPEVEVDPREDVAILQYTGGVTGTPKGAMLTHYNLVANTMQFREWFSAFKEGEERFMAALPLATTYGMTCVLNCGVYIGATLVLVPRFYIDSILKLIVKTRPTFFPGVPTMYVAFNNYPDIKKYDLSSVAYWNSGGAPLPLDVLERFEHLTGKRLVEGYGLAETSPVTHSNTVRGRRKVGSIGLPVSDTRAKIVDMEDGQRELGAHEVGELVISGPQIMKGYWNKPDETQYILKDGWLYTGDIAEMDEDGFFYIINRKKDMIISGGYNIYPREVEAVLHRHPKIKEAIIVGVPDDYYGEIVKAYIFCKGDKLMFEDEIIDFCLNKLASYKIPKIFEIRKLPRHDLRGAELRRYLIKESKGNR